MDHHNLKYTLLWRRLKYCIYMFFPEENKTVIVVKRYPFLVSVLLLPPEKGKNEQKPCWHPVTSFSKIHVYSKSFIWTYLIIFSPHLSGQGTTVRLQNKSWWFFLYLVLNLIPHSQTTSIIKHVLLCVSISFCLMLSWHCWQLTSSSEHRSRWSFAWFSVISDSHHLQWPWTIPSATFARRFGQNVVTSWRQISNLLDCPWFLLLSIFTQKPQKEWPHDVASSASRIGFCCEREDEEKVRE